MTTVLVWLLFVTTYGGAQVTVVERFADKTQCEHVRSNIPEKDFTHSVCVQANILVLK